MGVYVGRAQWPYRGQMYCHMVADTHKELEVMAWKIGAPRSWLREEGLMNEHYEIGTRKRDLAIQKGAIECTDRVIEEIAKRRRADRGAAYYGATRTKATT